MGPAQSQTMLEAVKEEKYLGVVIDSNLTFQDHIDAVTSKANRTLGIIRRTFKNLNKEMFLTLYKTLVRPTLEYCSPVWNPRLIKQKRQLEQIQRRATKLMNNIKNLSYSEHLMYLGLPTMEYRFLRADMIQTYKLVHGLEGLPATAFFQMDRNRATRGHHFKIVKARCSTNLYANTFSNRIVTTWNSLSAPVVEAESLNSLKMLLNNHWRHHPFKFTNSFDIN